MPSSDFADPAHPGRAGSLFNSRGAFIGIGLTSGFLNLLGLTGSLYMLQVYDRAIPGHSLPTLLALSVIALGLFLAQGFFDVIRARLLTRIGAGIDARLRERVFGCMVRMPLQMASSANAIDPPKDLDTVRAFLSSAGPTALFDIPWMPIYIALVFFLHPLLGFLAIAGAILMIGITALTEFLTKAPARTAAASGATRLALGQACRRNAEAVAGLGMSGAFVQRWNQASARHLADQVRAADLATTLNVASKIIRMALQSAVLGLGAYLVIQQQATAGVMIASSITVARALAPVELAVGNWRGFIAARQAHRRLVSLLAALPLPGDRLRLPPASKALAVEGLTVGAPGSAIPLIRDVSFSLTAGLALGVIGMSGSGKSTLARALVGAWQPLRGSIRLDGAALDQLAPDQLGRQLGYLPQDIELFEGTIAQNIARFRQDADAEKIVKATQMAGIAQLIMRLPAGYETQIGESGAKLSAGQRQRIGLARALYDDPFLLVLDEPNSNLDSDGEAALLQAIFAVRERGGIAVIVAHRPSALAAVSHLLVLHDGVATMFGPRDTVMQSLSKQRAQVRVVKPEPREDLTDAFPQAPAAEAS